MSPKDQVKEIFSFVPIVRTVAVFSAALIAYSFMAGKYTNAQEARIDALQVRLDNLTEDGSRGLQTFRDENAESHAAIIASMGKIKEDVASIKTDLKWLVQSQARETSVASRASP